MDADAREALKRTTGDLHIILKALSGDIEELKGEVASAKSIIIASPDAKVEELKSMIIGLRSQVDDARKDFALVKSDIATVKQGVVEERMTAQKALAKAATYVAKADEIAAKAWELRTLVTKADELLAKAGFKKLREVEAVTATITNDTSTAKTKAPVAFYVSVSGDDKLSTPRSLEYVAFADSPKHKNVVSLSLGFFGGGTKGFDLLLAPPAKAEEKKPEDGASLTQKAKSFLKDAVSPP